MVRRFFPEKMHLSCMILMDSLMDLTKRDPGRKGTALYDEEGFEKAHEGAECEMQKARLVTQLYGSRRDSL